MPEAPKVAGLPDSCLLDNPTLEHMKIPTETTISSNAIYFSRLENRPERIVLRPQRMHPQKGIKRREGHACGHPCSKSILSIILPRLAFKPRRLELARVAVVLGSPNLCRQERR
ncbi:hypothetical protein AVEN_204803-1 [Araneus ventricosus]|uniref:Uncharacterized protein n=1 Tax=Araneus ventricosus TaxID=182803 RepID=A0A4Y2WB30_ARAVE|nr:hypothetical protein AVEN_204803-1 [Araneus ventricosus]